MSATYRLQLRGPASSPDDAFTFADAEARIDYYAKLGVSHLYLSPVLTAPAASTHNYDVTDPTTINPELGGIEGLRSLAEAAHAAGIKLLVDIVPNHVGVDEPKLNAWWWDVLKHGQDSEFSEYFDIDWSEENGAGGRLGLPILGSEEDVEALEVDAQAGVLRYYEHEFPLAPGTENGTPQEVHDKQHYRLMYWRDGIINYRRFFSINGLAGLRQEDPIVFEHTHRILNQLIAADIIDGVRVDHPDGLADPFGYLESLRNLIGENRWLLVEKILGVTEPLDPRLHVDGTTGYDALREFDGVFVNRPAVKHMDALAEKWTGSKWDSAAFKKAEEELKAEVARSELAAEVRRLARAVRNDNWSTSGDDVPDDVLEETLVGLIAAMPVYRADYQSLSRVTSTVIAHHLIAHPERADALDLISTALLSFGEANTRFAQVCGAVMAKGVEDTAFYRGSRLVSLQEVGGAPGRFGVSPAEYHMLQAERARLWPRAMTALTTHDTKRGEDVRSRITAFTEVYEEFADLCEAVPYVDGMTCHFLLQNIVGVWPAEGEVSDELRARLHSYAEKAMREAGVHTTWFDNNEAFESSIHEWIDELIDTHSAPITEFVRKIDAGGKVIANSKKLLQLMSPGIPDIYQGTEFFTDSLVDPDNRRRVDYDEREEALERISRGDIRTDDDERLAMIVKALNVRTQKELDEASYLPVMARGELYRAVLGMMRGEDVITLVTRRPITVERAGGWGNTTVTLPEGLWEDQLASGAMWQGEVKVADLFSERGQALLTKLA
ncbi:Maltooligosyl trehalose synthase [Corynebacterium urogenitale]|uniref:Maltooligosyl trehalose synthase n=1 Tax=Corynebacterium urogenitale TaxID=2487892 RepID=A0A5J6ZA21_9CORY|nr:malto-oligosyltrehalose synthase [Corynebacterium urogenitale]QFQ02179.1 Maltooligosyl trehalose synthase [Corynebacterium urogenitale]